MFEYLRSKSSLEAKIICGVKSEFTWHTHTHTQIYTNLYSEHVITKIKQPSWLEPYVHVESWSSRTET